MSTLTNPPGRSSRTDLYPPRPPEASPDKGEAAAAGPSRPARMARTSKPPRRRHPANSTRAAALALSIAATGGLAYAFAAAEQAPEADLVVADPDPDPELAPSTASTPAPSAAEEPAATEEPAPAEEPAPSPDAATTTVLPREPAPVETSYVGEQVSTRWGPVQIEATLIDGELVDVVALQVPDDDRRSSQISETAEPQLRSAALESQSADVDTVSGATYTSQAYAESLQSAIDAAALDGIQVGLP